MVLPPLDETGRLATLGRYDILDTPSERVFDNIADLLSMILNVSIAGVTLMGEDRLCFKSILGTEIRELPRHLSFCSWVIDADAPVIINDTRRDERTARHPMVVGEPYLMSYAGVPLRAPDGHCLGTLCALDHVPRDFTMRQIEIMEMLAEIVIDQIELRHCAERDHLSGALSRHALMVEMDREISRYLRYHRPASLVIIDLDNFKEVNDRLGHPVGDEVLCMMASCCERVKRSGDSFGRLGGDEFVLLLPEARTHQALAVAERIRSEVQMAIIAGAPGLEVTVSLGVAELDDGCATAESWLKVADRGLYAAKNSGRNRCCIGVARERGQSAA